MTPYHPILSSMTLRRLDSVCVLSRAVKMVGGHGILARSRQRQFLAYGVLESSLLRALWMADREAAAVSVVRSRGPVPPILKLEIGGARRASSQRERERGVKWRQQGSSAPSLKRGQIAQGEREDFGRVQPTRRHPRSSVRERERHTHRATALDWTALRCWIFRHAAATWRCTGNSHCTRTFALSRSSLGQRGEQQQQQQLRSEMQSHARLAITSFSPHSNVAHLQHSYRHHTSNSLPSYSAAARLASSLLQPSSATSTPSGLAIPAHQPKPS